MKQKVAFITGVTGMDGSIISGYLVNKGYKVIGLRRRTSTFNTDRIEYLYNNPNFTTEWGNITDGACLYRLLQKYRPDEIYHLAAMSHVRVSFDLSEETLEVVTMGTLKLLNAMKDVCPKAKLYYAGSSVSGDTPVLIQKGNEKQLVEIQTLVKENETRTNYDNLYCLTIDNNYKTKWSKVSYVFKHKSNNLYKLKGSCGLDIEITGDHSVIVLDENCNLIEKKVENLNKFDTLLSYTSTQNQKDTKYPMFDLSKFVYNKKYITRTNCQLDEITINKDIMRLFGFYLAKGNVYINKNKKNAYVNFTFHIKEKYYTEDIKNILINNFKITSFHEREIFEKNTRHIRISSYRLAKFILEQFNTGSKNKTIPSWMYNIPKDGVLEFLRGYIGDAKIIRPSENSKLSEVSYTSVNKNMIENINYIAKLNGLNGSIAKKYNKPHLSPQKTIIKGSFCYDLKFFGKSADEILGIEVDRTKYKNILSNLLPSSIVKTTVKNSSILTKKNSVSKKKIIDFINKKGDEYVLNENILKLIEGDIHLIRIKSIEKLHKEIDVYDLHVPETQRFIGGNYPLLLHNSEQFGTAPCPQTGYTELSPMYPASPYACAKLAGYNLCKNYRNSYGLFISCGILFNHENPGLRGETFLTRKTAQAVAKIKLGLQDKLYLGNLEAKRDWGLASEYIKGMYLMLQQEKPDDFILATSETHSVREYVEETFKLANLDYNKYIEINDRLLRPEEVPYLLGDASKAKEKLGWEPKTKFKELVKLMYEYEINKLK